MSTSPSIANHSSPAEIEALDRSRRQMLVAVVVTTALWMIPQILRGIGGDRLPHTLSAVMILIGVAGALANVFFMLRYHRFQMRVLADPDLRERLDDERVLDVRREAIYRGWVILVLLIGLGIGVAPFADLPDQAVLLTLMLVAVNAPILFFLALDRG